MKPDQFKNAVLRNIADGIRKARESGVQCEMPSRVELDMALDADRNVCGENSTCVTRVTDRIVGEPELVTAGNPSFGTKLAPG